MHLTAAHVRQRFGGVSDMTIWRWLHDERLRFPQPITINRRRYWREAEIEAFEARQAAQAANSNAA